MFFVLELNDDEMMHTVISGPPGMAKTTIAETLGLLYANLGFLSSGHVLCATRSNLIGKYLGETSIKTGEVLNASLGGILIIDEAYSLGTKDGNDSYSSECLNTLNQFLSENPSDFMCIIAGYEKELKNRFFSMNPGLERRFPWWFKLEKYETNDLVKIFKFQVEKKEWKLHEDVSDKWLDEQIRNKKELFNMNGGDTLILMDKSKISHAQRIFLDGNELSHDKINLWKCKIGYVPQDVYLIDDTIEKKMQEARDSLPADFMFKRGLGAFVMARGAEVIFKVFKRLYKDYSKRYLNMEIEAKREKLGLWGGKFEMPWEWRRNAKK